MSKDFLLGATTAEDLFLETENDGLRADWILGVGAVGLDAETRTIQLADGATITAYRIVIATGARSRQLPQIGRGSVLISRTRKWAIRALLQHLPAPRRQAVFNIGQVLEAPVPTPGRRTLRTSSSTRPTSPKCRISTATNTAS